MFLKTIPLFMLTILWRGAQSDTLQHSAMVEQKQAIEVTSSNHSPIGNFSYVKDLFFTPLRDRTRSQQQNYTTVPYLEPFYYYTRGQNNHGTSLKSPRILSDKFENIILTDRETNHSVEDLSTALADLLYQPVAVLVDDSPNSWLNAMYFTDVILRAPNIHTEFWLMKFNATGVTSVTAQSRTNPGEFKKQLQQGVNGIQLSATHGSAVFFAVLKATQILPKKSAILVFSEKKSIDEDLAQLALNNLLQKNIRLHVIWVGTHPTQGHEEKLLKETALRSQGYFILGNTTNMSSPEHDFAPNPNILITSKDETLLKKRIFGKDTTFFPVDRTIKSLNIIIEGPFKTATLKSPQGYMVDLLDPMSVRRLSAGARIAHDPGQKIHVRFNTTKVISTVVVGLWELRTTGIAGCENEYDLTIDAETDLTVSSELFSNSNQEFQTTNLAEENEVQLKINGNISDIHNVTFIDITGQEIQDIPSHVFKQTNVENYLPQKQGSREFKVPHRNITLSGESFYVKVTGTNKDGEIFQRLSYVNRDIQSTKLPPIFIEISSRSELIATPGSSPKLTFEVTSNHDQAVFVPFAVQDEKSLLRNLQPRGSWIGPKQTIEVTVFTQIPVGMTLSSTDVITLMAQGKTKAQKSAILYISNERIIDNEQPYLSYRYTSNCREVSYSSCQSGTWTIEVTAQDSQSGLLKVVSNPVGLYAPNGYISGTKQSITSYYTSTCCSPYLEITAIDLYNNRRSYKTDANRADLSTGSIVAIVLGIIVIVIIIIIIGVLIRKRYKQRQSLDLPRYRGQIGTSRF